MKVNFSKSLLAASVMAASVGLSAPTFAAGNSSSNIVGTIHSAGNASGTYSVTATNVDTGTSRTIQTGADKNFRLAGLPIGTYKVSVTQDGSTIGQRTVRVTLGSNANADFDMAGNVEEVVVEGKMITSVDTYTMDSGLVMGESELDAMPVGRSLTAVALLAPGAIAGDTGFGTGNTFGAASFGGASIAENSCYINGLEVTNTNQGIGCSSVPFEFYKEFQVKTGGYSAEFGRTTGGVINSVTKSGGNTWEFGSTMYWEPDALRSGGSVSKGSDGSVFRNKSKNESEEVSYTFSASGPLIEDKLFFYGLVNPRSKTDNFAYQPSGADEFIPDTEYRKRDSSGSDNLFWGTKLDWDISDNHRLSYFGFSDRNETKEEIFNFDADTGKIGDNKASVFDPTLKAGNTRVRGSEANSFNYTGYFGNDLTVSALAGRVETEYTTDPWVTTCPPVGVTSTAAAAGVEAASCGGGSIGVNVDTNTQYRLDVNYVVGAHSLKGGLDIQERKSDHTTAPVGDHSYTYRLLPGVKTDPKTGELVTSSIQGNNGPVYTNTSTEDLLYVDDRIFTGGGEFHSDLTAFYLEDQWQLTDDLMLSIGLRKDTFEGYSVRGSEIYNFDTDIAPRLGFTWDPVGDGEHKFYGTWGRYYLPVANNTIYRAAAGIVDRTTTYLYDGWDPVTGAPLNAAPINGTMDNSSRTNSSGAVPTTDEFQAQNADPFARDELILGYDFSLNDSISLGVKGIFREVTSALDDYCGDLAPECILLNPGKSDSWYTDGELVSHSAADIGLPEGKNKYTAIQADMTYSTAQMNWKVIYTWSKSKGNFEGAVKSDIDQADAGITQDFDFPALMDGANGYLPNDRRHVLKVYGSYDFTEDLTFGMNATVASGRPITAFGQSYFTDDEHIYGSYGDTFYHLEQDGTYSFHPRGTAGRTPWTYNIDASMRYRFALNNVNMVASLDVFNLLDTQKATSVDEHYEVDGGDVNPYYGAAYDFQAPRSVRLGLEANF